MKYKRYYWPINEPKHSTCGRCIIIQKAQYSLDCDNSIEKAIVQRPPTPEEILENQQLRDRLYAAVMELPDKQAKWICAQVLPGYDRQGNCTRAESIDPSWVYKSLKRGLKHLAKKIEKV